MNAMPNRLVTIKELAEVLQVPVSWIYQRTRLGQTAIPHIKVGRYVRFNVEDVMRFLQPKPLKQNQIAERAA